MVNRTTSHDLNNQNFNICDRILVIVFIVFITSIFFGFLIDLLSKIIDLNVFEFLKCIIVFANIWALGFMVFDTLFIHNVKDIFKEVTETNLNSNRLVFRYILLPISFGIITIYIFGLLTIIIFNMLQLSQVTQRISIFFFLFYICELGLTIIFVSMNYKTVKSLLNYLNSLKIQSTLMGNIKNCLLNVNFFKNSSLLLSFLFLLILFISLILGEINFNFGFLNLMLVYLEFFLIIFLLFFYFQYKKKTPYIDIILIFVLVFSLSHLFISRGVTITGRTDIHKEFFYAQNTVMKMNWDPNEFEDNYNTIISISIFPMVLSVVFGIKIETFFELITPIIFGLFNISNYIILVRIRSRYCNPICSENSKIQSSSSFYVMFSLLVIIFIRSYTHQIAASSRIAIAYFLFMILCILLIEKNLIYGLSRLPTLFILLISVLLSHWGTFLFGITVIITSFIFFILYLSIKRYNLLINYLKIIKINKQLVFVGVFVAILIMWFFFLSPQITIFIVEKILPSVENLINNGIDKIIPSIISLLFEYRFFELSNPIVFLETIINLLFIIILFFSNLSKIIKIFQLDDVGFSDFFGVSSFIIIALMFLVPVLSSFYSPLRVGMQFWPFIAPIFFQKIRQKREFIFNFDFHSFLKKMYSIRIESILTIFIFLLLIFHQGIAYEIFYMGEISQSSEVLEAGESLSLVFRNYGVEAWKWLLTESDLKAIQWLNLQSPVSVYSDFPRAYMILSRIYGMTPEDNRVYGSYAAIRHLIETHSDKFIEKNSYIFISIQNLNSGIMFFHYNSYSTYEFISQLENLNASLVYNSKCLIYYFSDDE